MYIPPMRASQPRPRPQSRPGVLLTQLLISFIYLFFWFVFWTIVIVFLWTYLSDSEIQEEHLIAEWGYSVNECSDYRNREKSWESEGWERVRRVDVQQLACSKQPDGRRRRINRLADSDPAEYLDKKDECQEREAGGSGQCLPGSPGCDKSCISWCSLRSSRRENPERLDGDDQQMRQRL